MPVNVFSEETVIPAQHGITDAMRECKEDARHERLSAARADLEKAIDPKAANQWALVRASEDKVAIALGDLHTEIGGCPRDDPAR